MYACLNRFVLFGTVKILWLITFNSVKLLRTEVNVFQMRYVLLIEKLFIYVVYVYIYDTLTFDTQKNDVIIKIRQYIYEMQIRMIFTRVA